MKIKLTTRNETLYGHGDPRQPRLEIADPNPAAHPLHTLREYKRALNAAKVTRIFAKPFVAAIPGHRDAVKSIACGARNVNQIVTGGCDGQIRLVNLASRRAVRSVPAAHSGFVNAIAFSREQDLVLSAGQDGAVHAWRFHDSAFEPDPAPSSSALTPDRVSEFNEAPVFTCLAGAAVAAFDVSSFEDQILTGGQAVQLWDFNAVQPAASFQYGNGQITAVRFSRNEPHLAIVASYDNSLMLCDLRVHDIVQKVTLNMRSSALCFNPYRPFDFAAANLDSNVYEFDLRKFSAAKQVYAGCVHAALDVDYSPTGRELCAGSLDQTIRIWRLNQSKAREIYHNRRMQSVLQTKFTADGTFIVSGSADFNVRIWKARANEVLGLKSHRQQAALQDSDALIAKFQHLPEIHKIMTKRQVPKYILNAARKRHLVTQSERRKEANRVRTNPAAAEHVPLRKSMIRKVAFADAPRPAYAPAAESADSDSDSDVSLGGAARDSELLKSNIRMID